MKLQKMIVTNTDLSEFNSLQIAVKAKYYLECKTDSEIEQAFQFIKKNKIKFLILGEGTNVVFTKPYDGLIIKNSFKKENQCICYWKATFKNNFVAGYMSGIGL